MLATWRTWARSLKREVTALYLACRDPRVPWYAKAIAALVVAYALSPIDLIPDFIPVLGYVDDLLLVPLGVLVVRSMISTEILDDCRRQADLLTEKPTSWVGIGIVVTVWLVFAFVVASWWRRPT